MAILNYTTKIDAYKTITEIQQILSKRGANKITIDNNAQGQPVALTFCIYWKNNQTAFTLPCNFDGVKRAMEKAKLPKSCYTEEQALRVGWRILKDWVEAQMAIIEAEMASIPEVFLAYAITPGNETLFEYMNNNPNQKLLS